MALTLEVKGAAELVFEVGKLNVDVFTKESGGASNPPKPLLIASPMEEGRYPVVVFLHGFFLRNSYYRQLLRHIASHAFIVVAPQLYTFILPCSEEDINFAAAVTDWLSNGLQSLLPKGVEANLDKLALAGHSRGGHAAFSLALGYAETTLKFSVLIGIDPVAGFGKGFQIPPQILTYKPSSFDLDIPVLVVGTGLGEQKKNIIFPACAPDGVNHKEFFYECKPPCYYFVAKEYGHMDMLDDDAPKVTTCACKNGQNCRDLMRRSTAGIVVAFMKAYFNGEAEDLNAIVNDPQMAPTKLDPVIYREN